MAITINVMRALSRGACVAADAAANGFLHVYLALMRRAQPIPPFGLRRSGDQRFADPRQCHKPAPAA